MKTFVKWVMYFILGILFVIASYNIILNIRHYNSLNEIVIVSEADNDYSKYKDNIVAIEEKINNLKNKEDNIYEALSHTLNSMKKDGLFRLVPKTELNYKDLYNLNDYFMEELINNNWVKYINNLDVRKKHQDNINMLVNNSNYLNSVFTNNSLILNEGLDNKINDNYHFIINNYLMYSNIILDICNEIGG